MRQKRLPKIDIFKFVREFAETSFLIQSKHNTLSTTQNFFYLNILREVLQFKILEALSELPINKKLTFQGGTALRLIDKSSRFSEDLDFTTTIKFTQLQAERLREMLLKGLKELIENPIEISMKLQSMLSVFKIKVLSQDRGNKTFFVKLEIASVPSYTRRYEILNDEYNILSSPVSLLVESKEEMFADKIVAFGGRKILSPDTPFKSRDIWDIFWFSKKGVNLDYNLVLAKLKDYKFHQEKFFSTVEDRIKLMTDKNALLFFKNEMTRFLDIKSIKLLDNDEVVVGILSSVKEEMQKTLNTLKRMNL